MTESADGAAAPMLHIDVDKDTCQGLGYCERLSPRLFRVDRDHGIAVPLSPKVGPEDREDAIRAEEACPARAISLWSDKEVP